MNSQTLFPGSDIAPFNGVNGDFFIIVATGIFSPPTRRTKLDTLDTISVFSPFSFGNSLGELGLTETIETLERERAASFMKPENLERVGRREGRPGFAKELIAMTQDPSAFSAREKESMLQFVSNAYNDHIGAERTNVHLYSGPANTNGYFRPGGHTVFINRESDNFKTGNFAALVNTVLHENTHHLQDNPNQFSNPVLSRIYRANFNAYRNAQTYGYEAYRAQPIEAGAHAAGDMGEKLLRQMAGLDHDNAGPSWKSQFASVSPSIFGSFKSQKPATWKPFPALNRKSPSRRTPSIRLGKNTPLPGTFSGLALI